MERETAHWLMGKVDVARAALENAADTARCQDQSDVATQLNGAIYACNRAHKAIHNVMDPPVKPEADGADE